MDGWTFLCDVADIPALGARRVRRECGTDVAVSGQRLTEDCDVFNKLAKDLLGTNTIDTNSRLCMASAVSGYEATLGADAPPACHDDIADAGLVFITGSNLAWARPLLCRRLEDAKAARPSLKWIVVHPRRTETAAMAGLHLQIAPGSDVALLHGLPRLRRLSQEAGDAVAVPVGEEAA
jgi:assimilatory nitrate reductase catalytic subunit